jgi:hypothetical protein
MLAYVPHTSWYMGRCMIGDSSSLWIWSWTQLQRNRNARNIEQRGTISNSKGLKSSSLAAEIVQEFRPSRCCAKGRDASFVVRCSLAVCCDTPESGKGTDSVLMMLMTRIWAEAGELC